MDIAYCTESLSDIDWAELKARLTEDDFDNGRTADQLRRSFENSDYYCIAVAEDRGVIATARALSDRVCCAYLVDVWTYSPFRRMGVGSSTVETVLQALRRQQVFLQTDDAVSFYRSLGFVERPIGMELRRF